ncbi:MAG: family 1 glycosylhydrolase, partial [Chloroflexi bacterium]|nr:family 1 glycosylhydrolase [Chloroflexota bacterium]
RFLPRSQTIPQAVGTQDFLGLNYYTQDLVRFEPRAKEELYGRRSFPPDAKLSPSGMIANQPEGLFKALQWGKKFGLPMIVTENGIEDASDELRPRYLAEHIRELWRAVNFNYPIEGYFHWTLVDNFEWHHGWTQRFGLWELDINSQKRTKRTSAELYEAICKENGLSSQMVEKYAPVLLSKMFPGMLNTRPPMV